MPGGLIVHWHEQSLTFSPRVMRFTRGVTAQYGQTVVESDELEIHQEISGDYAFARGHVALTDPLGKIAADQLRFAWVTRTGYADNVVVTIDSVRGNVGRIELEPEKWTLKNVRAIGYTNKVALVDMSSPEIDITPGKRLVIRKPKFGLLGKLIGPFPDAHATIGSSGTGFRYPSVSYKQDHGFGVSWDSKFAVGKGSLFTGSYGNYARTIPSYGFHIAHTFIPGKDADFATPPRNELGDRFDPSYFQNALIMDPANDWKVFGTRKQTLALSTISNVGATGRDDFGHYSKPWDVAFEESGLVGSNGIFGQVRAQQMRRGGNTRTTRLVGWFSAVPKPISLSPQLKAYASGDGMVFSESGFHWGRLQGGLAYQPVPFLRFSGGSFWSDEWGNPTFVADRIDRKYGIVTRADLISGPTQFSYMLKFDPRGGGQYDREYALVQIIGIFRGYINYREYPSQFRYGLELRLDNLIDAFSKRSEEENKQLAADGLDKSSTRHER